MRSSSSTQPRPVRKDKTSSVLKKTVKLKSLEATGASVHRVDLVIRSLLNSSFKIKDENFGSYLIPFPWPLGRRTGPQGDPNNSNRFVRRELFGPHLSGPTSLGPQQTPWKRRRHRIRSQRVLVRTFQRRSRSTTAGQKQYVQRLECHKVASQGPVAYLLLYPAVLKTRRPNLTLWRGGDGRDVGVEEPYRLWASLRLRTNFTMLWHISLLVRLV